MGDLRDLGRGLKSKRRSKLNDDGSAFTLTNLKKMTGTAQSVFSALETYGHLPPRFATFRAYCQCINVDVDQLLAEHEILRRFYAAQLDTPSREQDDVVRRAS